MSSEKSDSFKEDRGEEMRCNECCKPTTDFGPRIEKINVTVYGRVSMFQQEICTLCEHLESILKEEHLGWTS